MMSFNTLRVIPGIPAGLRPGAHLRIRNLTAVAILGAALGLSTPAGAAPVAATEAACGDGVAVVVDFTDFTVDGQAGTVEVGCADGDPETGRAALVAAGFTVTDSQPGFLCAIDANPDPCPETFDGSFWSYWHSDPGGEWTSYQVGADSSDPVPGQIEGWRYNDGTTPPGISPADVAAAVTAGADQGSSDQGSSDLGGSDLGDRAQTAQGLALTVTALGFLALVVTLAVIFAVRARRRGPGGSD